MVFYFHSITVDKIEILLEDSSEFNNEIWLHLRQIYTVLGQLLHILYLPLISSTAPWTVSCKERLPLLWFILPPLPLSKIVQMKYV